jgi:hypothetical protein
LRQAAGDGKRRRASGFEAKTQLAITFDERFVQA